MVTCYLKYTIDPFKVKEFEEYGRMWIPLVNEMGGMHHGYFLPHEGHNNIAYALFSFPSLASYEAYRAKIPLTKKCVDAIAFAEKTKCIISYERSFMKPVFE
jgi:NIPSNAP